VGNLASDGRPILGLDSRNLLEITLSGGDGCYLVPAHAWTPWFAVLGSQSGFDRVADCYADLASHIFAIETGLSSDPEMNWRVSSLDDYRLVSNSDAHSPPMLGREATTFTLPGEADYFRIYQALRTGDGFGGTVEFFPEEGKYHLDGHRACDVRMTPEETREAGGKCPACGKKPTIGVQHRVDTLADRPSGYRPEGAAGFTSFVPLPEIIGEIVGVGPKSKSVAAQVSAMVERFGPELGILGDVPLDDLAAGAPSIVAEAIGRLRRGDVRREAGYDGVYGTIKLFDDGELGGAALFDIPKAPRKSRVSVDNPATSQTASADSGASAPLPPGLDPEQRAIVTHDGGPLLVVAGPGAGKTRVLTHALAHRIGNGLAPENCLAVTFTRRARDELRERLAALLGTPVADQITVATFHGLGLLILREQRALLGIDGELKVADEKTRRELQRLQRLPSAISAASADSAAPADERRVDEYTAALRSRGMVDLDELVTLPTALLAASPSLAESYRSRWTDVFVDEYQDVDEQQYLLLRQLAGPGARTCAIGDPDQAIYGFRGGDVGYFLRFGEDFSGDDAPASTVQLSRSYRSAPTIVRAAMQLIRPGTLVPGRELIPARTDIPDSQVVVHAVADDREEAEAIAAEIERLLGGASLTSFDSGAVDGRNAPEHHLSFADFAVLYRTSSQAAAVGEALAKRGFPFQRRAHSRLTEMTGVPEILAQLSTVRSGTLGSAPGPIQGGCDSEPTIVELLAAAARRAVASLATQDEAHGSANLELRQAELRVAIRTATDVLETLAVKCGTDLDRFLDELELGAEVDTWDPRADRISLLTLHAAKGLEFPVVFIVGCDDGLLPLRSWKGAEVDYAEERRLLFVGMTRATTRLTLYTATKRLMRGELTECSPSPFLSSIDSTLLDRRGGNSPARSLRKPRDQQPTLF
jgi:DNA helicase II / ATP-dependent DNA helicase PcrA